MRRASFTRKTVCFNVDRAHSILAQLQELRPKIFSIIEALNRYAAQIGKPRIERRRLDV